MKWDQSHPLPRPMDAQWEQRLAPCGPIQKSSGLKLRNSLLLFFLDFLLLFLMGRVRIYCRLRRHEVKKVFFYEHCLFQQGNESYH